MGFSAVKGIVALCIAVHLVVVNVEAQVADQKSLAQSVEWASTVAMYYDIEGEDGFDHRRSLYGRGRIPMHYYISYGALSANRVLCPPRSGRSYYTHNCFRSSQPVNPYTRGCSCITRCRR